MRKFFLSLVVASSISCQALQAAGIADALAGLETSIHAGALPNIHSVIIEQDGSRLAEWYFTGADERRGTPLGSVTFDATTLHDVRSVTKSIVALVFGIARSEGLIGSLDTPVLDFFPEHADLRTPALEKITLRHVLAMTSGLKWDERTYPYTDARNSEIAMDRAPDKVRHIFSQTIVAPPGEVFAYSGGDVALIAEVVARVVKLPLEQYAKAKLFAPLGITNVEWLKDEAGMPIAASGLRMLPADMLKIGQMILGGGWYNEQQVVPAEWVATVTEPADIACKMRDHYFWWGMSACSAREHPAWYAAMGNGGQRITVIPSADVVIVMTAGNYNAAFADKVADTVLLKVLAALQ